VWRGVEKTRTVPVQRFRCTQCKRTFSFLPWFLLRFIWFAALVVQKCWEEWNQGASTVKVAERHGVSLRTLRRWRQVVWERRREIEQTVRRHVADDLPDPPVDNPKNHRPWSQHILNLLSQYLQHVPIPPNDKARVPYHFVRSLK